MRILALPSRREAPEPSTPGATLAGSRSPPGGSTLGAVAASDVHLLLCVPRLWARAPSLAPIAARLVRRAVAGLAARGRGDSGGGCGLAEALPPVAEGSGCGDGGTEVGGARALAALLGNIIEAGYPSSLSCLRAQTWSQDQYAPSPLTNDIPPQTNNLNGPGHVLLYCFLPRGPPTAATPTLVLPFGLGLAELYFVFTQVGAKALPGGDAEAAAVVAADLAWTLHSGA